MTLEDTKTKSDTALITLPLHLVEVKVFPKGLFLSDCMKGVYRHHRWIPFATPLHDDETISKFGPITFFPMAQVHDGKYSTWTPLSETFHGDTSIGEQVAP